MERSARHAVFLVAFLIPTQASAQTTVQESPPFDTVQTVQDLFHHRFCGEASRFAESDLRHHSDDLAAVYRAARTAYCTGDYIAAKRHFERFLQLPGSGESQYHDLAERFLRNAGNLIATIAVNTENPEPIEGLELVVNGQVRPLGVPLEVNPGRPVHFEIHAPGYVTRRETHDLSLGQHYETRIPLSLDNRSPGLSAWFWAGLGAVVVGGTTGAILLSRGSAERALYDASCPSTARSSADCTMYYESTVQSISNFEIGAVSSFVVAGIGAVAMIYSYVSRPRTVRARLQMPIRVLAGLGTGGLEVVW